MIVVTPVKSVRDLGIYVDSDLSMRTTVSGCFAILRQLRSVRRSVTKPVLQSLVVSLVLSRLDYSSRHTCWPPCTTAGQIAVRTPCIGARARLIYSARKSDHVTPLLRDLHWLRYPQRIEFRLAVLTFRCLHGAAPQYLAGELQRVADMESRRRLRSASTALLHVPVSKHKTIGDRAFPAAASRVWNGLPLAITSLSSPLAFRRELKTELFRRSFGAQY